MVSSAGDDGRDVASLILLSLRTSFSSSQLLRLFVTLVMGGDLFEALWTPGCHVFLGDMCLRIAMLALQDTVLGVLLHARRQPQSDASPCNTVVNVNDRERPS